MKDLTLARGRALWPRTALEMWLRVRFHALPISALFVELEEGLEGLCHISELSDERIDRAESVAELGQENGFQDPAHRACRTKDRSSHRAVGKEDEPVADTKMYSTEAKGGMAFS